MKTLLLVFFIFWTSGIIAQCNISQNRTYLDHVKEHCGDIHFSGKITHNYSAYNQCGDITFTPPGTFSPEITHVIEAIRTLEYVYPNPFREVLTLRFDNNSHYQSIEILNLIGNLVDRVQVVNNGNYQELNLGHLRPGAYILKLGGHGKHVKYHKIIKL